jgi:hypothetical protein
MLSKSARSDKDTEMADPAETLLKILETLTASQQRLVETLTRTEERRQDHTRAMTQFMAESHRAMEENLQRLSAQIDAGLQRLSAQIADSNRAMAEILERVVHTTDRTEQITARILAEIGVDLGH